MNRIFLAFIGSLIISFQVFGQRPFVTNLDRTTGAAGDKLSISGINFPANPANVQVNFGAGIGTVTYASTDLLEVTVPGNATFGNVSVTNLTNGLIGYSSEFFTLAFGGTAFAPASVAAPGKFPSNQNGMYDLCTCDFDGDGIIDVSSSQNSDQASRVPVFRNTSTVSALAVAAINLPPLVINAPTINVTCGDLDGDGKPELLATGAIKGVTPVDIIFIFRNTSMPGNINFDNPTSLTLPKEAASGNLKTVGRAFVIDLDGDGKPEVIATNQVDNNVDVFKNSSSPGSLSFETQVSQFTIGGTKSFGLTVRDLNNDGFPEIVASELNQPNVHILPNTSNVGAINFGTSITAPVTGGLANMVIGDLNGDGLNDIAVTKITANEVAVLLNQTNGVGADIAFGAASSFGVSSTPWGIDLGDLDGNGKLDLLVASTTSNNVTVLSNQSAGTLAFTRFNIGAGEPTRNVAVADMNADGKPDLLATGITNNNLIVFPNRNCITPQITPDNATVCAGTSFALEATKSKGHTYLWETASSASGPFTTVSGATTSSLNLSSLAAGSVFVRVNIKSNDNSCDVSSTSESQLIVTGAPPVPPNITAPAAICSGATLEIDGTVAGAKSYEWTGPGGFVSTNPTLQVANFGPSNAGIYTFRYVTQSDCLSAPLEIRAEVKSLPPVAVRYDGNGLFCENATVSLSSAIYSGYNYQWLLDGGAIAGAATTSLTASASGAYAIRITDAGTNCSIVSETLALARKTLPVSQFSSADLICVDVAMDFTATSTGEAGLTLNYNWDFLTDGVIDATGAAASHTYTSSGTAVAQLTTGYNEIAGCSTSSTKNITVRAVPVVDITASQGIEKCPENSLPLEVPNSYISYSWNTGETTNAIVVDDPGTYSLTIADDAQCTILSSIVISNYATANTIAATANRSLIDEFDTTQFIVSGASQILNWDPITGFVDPTSPSPIVTGTYVTGEQLNAQGQREYLYVVTALNGDGCEVSASVPLLVIPDEEPQPMKSFSPNNDGVNDFWVVENVEFNQDCKLVIYDRRGAAVIEVPTYNNDWDGRTANGKEMEQGVYYYVFICNDATRNRNGSILLFR